MREEKTKYHVVYSRGSETGSTEITTKSKVVDSALMHEFRNKIADTRGFPMPKGIIILNIIELQI